MLSTPNVVSLGFSDEEDDGKETGGRIFRVEVIKKLPKEKIKHPDVFIPKFFKHTFDSSNKRVVIPVTVVEEGELEFIDSDDESEDEGPENDNPTYQGGSLIKLDGMKGIGCLGVNTQHDGSYRLLSAAHVLTKFDSDNIGKAIFVKNDQGKFVPIGAKVTGQAEKVKLFDSPKEPERAEDYADQDLAWADITKEKGSPEIKMIGTPGTIRKLREYPKEEVKYYAGRSNVHEEKTKVKCDVSSTKVSRVSPDGTKKYAFFKNLCRIEAKKPLKKGDSGTAIVSADQDENSLLGILIAGPKKKEKTEKPNTGYFCKLEL